MNYPFENQNLSNTYLEQQNYRLIELLGVGAFGETYLAQIKQKEVCAIKLQRTNCQIRQILYEAKVYAFLNQDFQQLDKVSQKQLEQQREIIITWLWSFWGNKIEDLFAQCHHKLSIKIVSVLAEQMVSRLEFMHSRSFIHCDVKNDNFLMGIDKKQVKLMLQTWVQPKDIQLKMVTFHSKKRNHLQELLIMQVSIHIWDMNKVGGMILKAWLCSCLFSQRHFTMNES